MLIKLAFYSVYTSPFNSAALSGVSFFFLSNSQRAKKRQKAILLSKPHYDWKRKINRPKDKTIPSALNHHDERKCTFL